MSEALEKAARAVTRSDGWRWMPGMLCMRIDYGTGPGDEDCVTRKRLSDRVDVTDLVFPDLDDPATLGCLIHLVRVKWRVPDAAAMTVSMTACGPVWQVIGQTPGHSMELGPVASTEAEALVASLLWVGPIPEEWPEELPW